MPAPPPLQVPQATARTQADVDEDFDHAKPNSQVPYNTFLNWANDYLRNFGDDDLAFLCASSSSAKSGTNEDASLFEVPLLGPHYLEAWHAMDAEIAAAGGEDDTSGPLTSGNATAAGSQAGTNSASGVNGQASQPGQAQIPVPQPNAILNPLPLRKFKTENMTNEALPTENVFLGPLSERLMSAFRHTKSTATSLELATSSDPSASGMPPSTAPGLRDMDAAEFEARLVKELAFLGAIPPSIRQTSTVPASTSLTSSKKQPNGVIVPSGTAQEPASSASINWAAREDDDISVSLRACQRLLKQQISLNEARKSRLADLVRERMAMQEYESLREGLENVIEQAWHKRQRAAARKTQKDKKEKASGDKEKDKDKEAAATLAASLAALNQPQPLSATLISALTKRRNLVDGFASIFPNDLRSLPIESVYRDLPGQGRNIAARSPE